MNADCHTSALPPPPSYELQRARRAQEKPHPYLLDFSSTLGLPCSKNQRLRLRQSKADGCWEALTHTATCPVAYRTSSTPHPAQTFGQLRICNFWLTSPSRLNKLETQELERTA